MIHAEQPALPNPLSVESFDLLLLHALERGASTVVLRSGEPLTLRHGAEAPRALDPRPLVGSEVLSVSRYVYGEYAGYLLGGGHVLKPRHEVRFGDGRTVRCSIEIAQADGVFSLVADLSPRPLDA